MKTTQQPDDPGQTRRLCNITEGLWSSQTHGVHIGDLAVTACAAAIEIGRQGESL